MSAGNPTKKKNNTNKARNEKQAVMRVKCKESYEKEARN